MKILLAQLKLNYRIFGELHKVSIKHFDCLLIFAIFSKSTKFFADSTLGMIGNKTRHLLKSVNEKLSQL